MHGELTGDDLVAAVYANPASDEPRLVYGDYLLERDDPRGEFVQLQLARHASGAPSTPRERLLFAEHVATWTAPLWPALHPESIGFERGFLAQCATRDRTIDLRDVIGHPMWITVEELTSHDASLVAHPCMRSLLRLRTSAPVLAALADVAHEVPLTHVEIGGATRFRSFVMQPWPEDESHWARIRDVGALRHLRALAIASTVDFDAAATTALLNSKLGLQLTTLAFEHERGPIEPWEAILRAHRSLRRIAIRSERGYDPHQPRHAVVAFERDRHGALRTLIEIAEQLPYAALLSAVKALPGPRTIGLVAADPRIPISDETLGALSSRLVPHSVIRVVR